MGYEHKRGPYKNLNGHKGVRGFLKDGLPDFCWQTFAEIITVLKCLDKNINVRSTRTQLGQLIKKDAVEFRRTTWRTGGGQCPYVFKRKGNS